MSNGTYHSQNQVHISRRHLLTLGLSAVTCSAFRPAIKSQEPHPTEIQLTEPKLPEVPLRWTTDAELIRNFAIELPDTPWRRAWNAAYKRHSDREDQYFAEYREFLDRHDSELVTADNKFDENARNKLSEEFESQFAKKHPVDPRDKGALESGGERIVDGGTLNKALGMSWWMMDCRSYCFSILRRGADSESEQRIEDIQIRSAEIRQILSMGYYPVRDPKDFDLVVYGDIEAQGEDRLFLPGHFGICKDGKVISKDILSIHVYKHPVEESAAYASHVMYFRHASHPDPRTLPLPQAAGPVHFVDRDGVATPVLDPDHGLLDTTITTAAGLGATWLALCFVKKALQPFFPPRISPSSPDTYNERPWLY